MIIRTMLAAVLAITLAACGMAETNYAASDPMPDHVATQLESTVLGETRDIAIWLPPGYEGGAEVYPVVYMPDGGVTEDFPHIANTLAELVEAGDIAPVILVGVSNTERGRDMTPASNTDYDKDFAPQTDGAANFRAFFRDELIPMIESQYRTNGERAIIGESLAGLFVTDSFFREPAIFQRHIAMDPSIWWDNGAIANTAGAQLAVMDHENVSLWFAGSDAEDIKRNTDALAEAFRANTPQGVRWKYVPKPDEQHNTIFRATKEEAFRWALWPATPDAPPVEALPETAPEEGVVPAN